jgi:hypothetical protein
VSLTPRTVANTSRNLNIANAFYKAFDSGQSPVFGPEHNSIRQTATLIASQQRRNDMSIGMILLIVLVLALVGVIPAWPHSRGWGYGPSGGIGTVLLILLILLLLGKI